MKQLLRVMVFVFICFFPFVSSAATIYTNTSTGNDTTGAGTIGSPYATFHKAYTVASSGDTLNLTGIFTLSSSTETGDVVTSGYTITKSLEIVGNGPDLTIIQSSTTTADRRVFTLSSAATTTIRNLAIRYGRVSSSNDGGCILNSGTTTIINVEIYSCTNTADYGGGISNRGTMDISSSTIYSNSAYYGGGGIAQNFSATGNLIATNNTIYGNTVTSSGGAFYGAGIYAGSKIVTLTNNTITANTNNSGLGSGLYAGAILYLKNNIIVANVASSYPGNADYHYASASTTSNGNNIIGRASTYNWVSTGDWTDSNGDSTFVLNTIGTTGIVNFDSTLSFNDNPNKTKTLGVLSGSIAINNGSSGSNSTTTVPTTDQRGALRNSTLDIGSFEYDGGGFSISAPGTQASGITISLNEYNRAGLFWTNGDGIRRTVFMKQASSGTASPVDGTRYTANTIFGNGDQIGSSGWYAVYDGYSTSTTITGLTQSTTYIVHITEYNGIGTGASIYNTNTSTNNTNTVTTYTPTTLYINSSTGSDSNSGSSDSPYATFYKGYTSAQSGDTLNMSGTFTWTDTAEIGDVTVSGYILTKNLNIVGQGAQTTIIQATSTDNTADRRIFTISNSTTTLNLSNITLRNGKGSADGGCYYSTASTTITNVEMYNCRSTGGYGGAVYNGGYITINGSTFYNNTVYYGGGGLASTNTATNTIITNSTFYSNLVTASSGAFYGGGIYVSKGNLSLTNSTITANTVTSGLGGGLQLYNTTNYVNLKNNLIASNTATYYTGTSDFHTYTANSNITSTYNIIGRAESYGWSSTGDWTDSNGDRTFVLNTAGTTGTVNFDSAASLNTTVTGTKTWAVLVSSIAINKGTTGTNGSSTVPTLDQRGASRNGLTDIGAYEYGGSVTDTTAPVISSIASSTNATTTTITWTTDENATSTIFYGTTSSYGYSSTTISAGISQSFSLSGLTASTVYHFMASSTDASGNTATSSDYTFLTTTPPDTTIPTVSIITPITNESTSSTVTLVASSTDNVAVAGVSFYVNGTLQGSEDTVMPYSVSWDSTATSSGSKTVFAVARDSSNNFATSSSVIFTVANTGVTPTTISVSSATNTATIIWTTSALSSSKVNFGPTTELGSSTVEIDISPRVTSHSVFLVQLPKCALINYRVISRNTVDVATSSNNTFTTKGCIGGADITSSQVGGITTNAGGSVNNDTLTLTVPTSFTSTSTSATFQANKLDSTTFFASAGIPSGKNKVGSDAYNLKALIDATTTLSTFSTPLSVSLTYNNSDITGLNEDTLKIYRYDSDWSSLSDCSVNKNSKTVTCTTTNFSDFALFGDEVSTESNTTTTTISVHTGTSITSQVSNLISIGNIALATDLQNKWPQLFPKINSVSSDLEFGMNGEEVKKLQLKLISKNTGPKARALSRVGATGYFGAYTKEAVIEFQTDKGIYPTYGYFGSKTKSILFK